MKDPDNPPRDALAASTKPLRARTLAEALLYLRVRGAAILGTQRTQGRGKDRLEVMVLHGGQETTFTFDLLQYDASDPVYLGDGAASALLDPADLVLFASRVERGLPDDLDGLTAEDLQAHLRELDLAAEAADEATKFIPRREDRVPIGSMSTAAARWLYESRPERFTRPALLALSERLRRRAIWYQEALRRRAP